jgi:hypothetical protein
MASSITSALGRVVNLIQTRMVTVGEKPWSRQFADRKGGARVWNSGQLALVENSMSLFQDLVARKWYSLAQEARRKANEIGDSEARLIAFSFAQDYDRLSVGAAMREHAYRQRQVK